MDGSPKAPDSAPREDEVVLLEDLAPRRDVEGGRKITLGEHLSNGSPSDPVRDAVDGVA